MPTEKKRKTRKIRVSVGGGSVDVPIIDEITFIDESNRHWEVQFTHDNDGGDRETHDARIESEEDEDVYIDVERIDVWKTIDLASRGELAQWKPDNVTGEDVKSAHFETHLVTHVKRITSEDDENVWIDMERIDEIIYKDTPDRGQETHFYLAAWEDEQ